MKPIHLQQYGFLWKLFVSLLVVVCEKVWNGNVSRKIKNKSETAEVDVVFLVPGAKALEIFIETTKMGLCLVLG